MRPLLQAVIDALGNINTTTYNAAGLVLTTIDPLGVQTSTIYDSYNRGLVVETIDGVGGSLETTNLTGYDAAGNPISPRDADGWTADTSYTPDGEELGTTDALGNTTRDFYDLAGQLLASRDAVGNVSSQTYNSVGEVVTSTDALGNVTTNTYDKDGNQVTTTDPLGRVTTYIYDALDRQTGTIDPLGRQTTTVYDADSNVTSQSDAMGVLTTYAYNADNEQISMTVAAGTSVQETTGTGYDADGNVITTTDGRGQVTTSVYDADNRQIASINPVGEVTSTAYDKASDVISSTDALGKVTTYVLDGLERQIAVIDPLGHTTTSILDGDGNETETIDANGNTTQSVFNADGEEIESIDDTGAVTQTAYDGDGDTRMVVDSDGNETHYVNNGDGETTVTTDPLGNATTTVFDAAGRETSVTDGDGRVIDYSYDNGDRLTGEVWLSSSGVTLNIVTNTYDNDDNLLTATDMNGTVTYTYDGQDRVQSYTNIFGQVLTYTYNSDDEVTQRTDSLGGVLTNVYDNDDRLTTTEFSGSGATGTVVRVDFAYDNRDDQTGITWFSDLGGTTTIAHSAYAYDNADRLTSITNTNASSTVLSAYTYTYDAGDRVTSQQHWSEVGTTVYSGLNSYTYDANNQLLSDGVSTYSYDSNGNRTMTGYATGGNNQMTSDGVYTYTYDNVGNLIEKSEGTGLQAWFYTYDNENHLISARETSNGTTNIAWTTFTYDATGAMVAEQTWATGGSATTTRFLLDGTNVIADLDGSNNLEARYLYEVNTDQILARTVASGANAGLSVYLTDNQGSVCDIVNASGAVTNHIDYTGYGVATESNASVGDSNLYDGYQYMVTVGLYYVQERWYNPTTGTWNAVDPDSFTAGQPNLYDYVGNDPTNATDPTGLAALGTETGIAIARPIPGTMGKFTWPIGWAVSNSNTQNGGYVFQRVTIRFKLNLAPGTTLANVTVGGARLSTFAPFFRTNNNPLTWTYWEAWRVAKNRTIPVGNKTLNITTKRYSQMLRQAKIPFVKAELGLTHINDVYAVNQIAGAKSGVITFIGEAYFIDNLAQLPNAFRPTKQWAGGAWAGSLESTPISGGIDAQMRQLIRNAGNNASRPFAHSIQVRFNADVMGGKTDVNVWRELGNQTLGTKLPD